MRSVVLVFWLAVGLVVGAAFGNLVVAVLATGHPVSPNRRAVIEVVCALLGTAVGWRRWHVQGAGEAVPDVHGSAAWAAPREVRAAYGAPRGLVVERENAKGGGLLRYDGPAHLLTLAPTRSGKGVGAIIPKLLLADRSVLCVDPKGENARVTARRREAYGPVHVLDPSGSPAAPAPPSTR